MSDTTNWGFPKGRVAKTLRSILDPGLTDHQVEAVVVCLMAHLLVENRINEVLYRWLKRDAPAPNDPEQALWNSIVKIDFAKKYSLLEPLFAAHFPRRHLSHGGSTISAMKSFMAGARFRRPSSRGSRFLRSKLSS